MTTISPSADVCAKGSFAWLFSDSPVPVLTTRFSPTRLEKVLRMRINEEFGSFIAERKGHPILMRSLAVFGQRLSCSAPEVLLHSSSLVLRVPGNPGNLCPSRGDTVGVGIQQILRLKKSIRRTSNSAFCESGKPAPISLLSFSGHASLTDYGDDRLSWAPMSIGIKAALGRPRSSFGQRQTTLKAVNSESAAKAGCKGRTICGTGELKTHEND